MSWKAALALASVLALLIAGARLLQDDETGTATWDASRAAGFVGYLLLWLSVASGMSIHLRVRPSGSPLTYMLELHRITSTLGLTFVAGHVLAILLDPVVTFSWYDGLVPFTSDYRPVQVGLGTFAQWLLAGVLISTAVAGRMPFATWRRIHYLSFPCYALALLHGVTSGTDSGSALVLVTYASTAAAVAAIGVLRVAGRGWVKAAEAAASRG